jgi:hypothetical protein
VTLSYRSTAVGIVSREAIDECVNELLLDRSRGF